jgi:hypothetical protein
VLFIVVVVVLLDVVDDENGPVFVGLAATGLEELNRPPKKVFFDCVVIAGGFVVVAL